MPTIISDVASFVADRAWGARNLLEFEGDTTARLHWTDKPYVWHANEGPEAFVVLTGAVDMHYRDQGIQLVARLGPTDIFLIGPGEEHYAEPIGEARILVIERKGSA